jgi:hypothetical protein
MTHARLTESQREALLKRTSEIPSLSYDANWWADVSTAVEAGVNAAPSAPGEWKAALAAAFDAGQVAAALRADAVRRETAELLTTPTTITEWQVGLRGAVHVFYSEEAVRAFLSTVDLAKSWDGTQSTELRTRTRKIVRHGAPPDIATLVHFIRESLR